MKNKQCTTFAQAAAKQLWLTKKAVPNATAAATPNAKAKLLIIGCPRSKIQFMIEAVDSKGVFVKAAQRFYTSLNSLQMYMSDRYNGADDHDAPIGIQIGLEEAEADVASALENICSLFPDLDDKAVMAFCSSGAVTGSTPLFLPQMMKDWKKTVGNQELNPEEKARLLKARQLGITKVELNILLDGAMLNQVV